MEKHFQAAKRVIANLVACMRELTSKLYLRPGTSVGRSELQMPTHFNRCVFVHISDDSQPDPFCVFEYEDDLVTPNLRHDEFDAAIAKIAKELSNNQLRVQLSIEILSYPAYPAIVEQRLELIRQRLVARGLSVDRISALIL